MCERVCLCLCKEKRREEKNHDECNLCVYYKFKINTHTRTKTQMKAKRKRKRTTKQISYKFGRLASCLIRMATPHELSDQLHSRKDFDSTVVDPFIGLVSVFVALLQALHENRKS